MLPEHSEIDVSLKLGTGARVLLVQQFEPWPAPRPRQNWALLGDMGVDLAYGHERSLANHWLGAIDHRRHQVRHRQ